MRRTLLGVCRLLWTLILFASQVWSEELPSPQDVRLDAELLRWDPAPGSLPVRYTAQFLNFGPPPGLWRGVPGCERTNLSTCRISSIPERTDCVRLRVRAETGEHTSTHVEAYSQDQSCSPVFALSALPGRLSVSLYNYSERVSQVYAYNHQCSIHYTRDGRPQTPIYTRSSETLKGLQAGEQVCVKLQYFVYGSPYGPPSQEQCAHIPDRERDAGEIVGICVAVLFIAAFLVLAMAYVIINKRERIKKLLQPPLQPPEHIIEFLSPEFSLPAQIQTQTDCEERYDPVSLILPTDPDTDRL